MSLSFQIALRSLFSRRSRLALSAIGWVAIFGLLLGTAVQTLTLAVLDGFEKSITRSILDFNAHLVIMGQEEVQLPFPDEQFKPYESQGLEAWTPYLYRVGMIAHHSKVKGFVLKGIDPQSFSGVYRMEIKPYLASPSSPDWTAVFQDTGEMPTVILGADLAEAMGVKPEDPVVSILSPKSDVKNIADARNFKRFKVVGTFSTGIYEYDSQFLLMSLAQAQDFFQAKEAVSGYGLRFRDPSQVHPIARLLQAEFGNTFSFLTWDQLNAEIFYVLSLEKTLFFLIMGLIIAIAATNLIGLTLILMTRQSKEIVILRALGFSPKALKRIFQIQGLVIGGLGVFSGCLLGGAISYFLAHHSVLTLSKEWYQVSALPVSLSWKNILSVAVFSFSMAYLATTFAARRVMKRI